MAGGQIVRGALLSWKCTALSLEGASGHEEVSGYEPRVSKFTSSVTTGRDRKRSSGNNQIGYSSITRRAKIDSCQCQDNAEEEGRKGRQAAHRVLPSKHHGDHIPESWIPLLLIERVLSHKWRGPKYISFSSHCLPHHWVPCFPGNSWI